MTPLFAAVFAAVGGWHVGAGQVHACPGVKASRCVQVTSWASTVPWRDCANCLPHRTIASLPKDGIAIQLLLARESYPSAKPFVWPPRVTLGDRGGIEGVPARYGVYQRFGRVGALEVYAWVFFGRAQPTANQLARANAELASVRL